MSRHSRLFLVLAPGLAFSKLAFAVTVNVGGADPACDPANDAQTVCSTASVRSAILKVNDQGDATNTIQITAGYDVTAVTGNDGDAEVSLPALTVAATIRSSAADPTTNAYKLRTVRTTADLTLENLVIKAGDVVGNFGSSGEEISVAFSAIDADYRSDETSGKVTGSNLVLEQGDATSSWYQDRDGVHGVVVLEGHLELTDVQASGFDQGYPIAFWDGWYTGADDRHDISITDGTFTENPGLNTTAVARIMYAGNILIADSTFEDNYNDAVYVQGGDMVVRNTDFIDNQGRGLYFRGDGGEGGSSLLVTGGSSFTDNYAYQCCQASAALAITRNRDFLTAVVEDTHFAGNWGYNSGDIFWGPEKIEPGGTLDVRDVVFENFSGGEGSAYLHGGRSRFTDVTWDGNGLADGGEGINSSWNAGALTMRNGGLEVLRGTFQDTHSFGGAGAVDLWGDGNSWASFEDTSFARTGSPEGAESWADGDGGAMAVYSGVRVDLDNVSFTETRTFWGYGGAMYLRGADYFGGYNEDPYWGWVGSEPPYMYGGEAGALVYGHDVTVDGAQAVIGGAFAVDGMGNTLSLDTTSISNTAAIYPEEVPPPPQARADGGMGGVGGVVAAFIGNTIEIHGAKITATEAANAGGVIYAASAPANNYYNNGPFVQDAECWLPFYDYSYSGEYFGSKWVLEGVEQSGAKALFESSVATFGRFDDVTIHGSSFTGNVTGDGAEGGFGTIVANSPSRFEASCNTFCDNEVLYGGAAIHLFDDGFPNYPYGGEGYNEVRAAETSSMLAAIGYGGEFAKEIHYAVRNNVFNGNTTAEDWQGGTVYYDICDAGWYRTGGPGFRGTLEIENNTFVGNFGGEGNLAGASGDAPLDVRNNLFQDGEVGWYIEQDNLVSEALGAIGYFSPQTSRFVEGGYNLYGNVTEDVVDETVYDGFPGFGFPDATDVLSPAVFRDYTPGACDSVLFLEAGPGVDQGDPDESMNDNWEAVPGTPNRGDIGAYGGPGACVADDDCDTWNAILDCDDQAGTSFPGADEVPYDGIDQDCSGADLCDVDGDGVAAAFGSCAGTDCNDLNAAIHPGATDILDDGIDQDCSGSDAVTDEDVDNDGHNAEQYGGHDCDDANAGISPTAEEIPYDGIDQDCDGEDLIDVDCDGHAAEEAGGDDCNDNDPTIHPGAPEAYDNIDQNCDGEAAEFWAQGGCGCATPAAAPATGGFGILAAAMAFLRRRRGQR